MAWVHFLGDSKTGSRPSASENKRCNITSCVAGVDLPTTSRIVPKDPTYAPRGWLEQMPVRVEFFLFGCCLCSRSRCLESRSGSMCHPVEGVLTIGCLGEMTLGGNFIDIRRVIM
ncbi:hypothetical protein HYFRA_00013692 [Hymenoscyphus fraxineus]|uniref:Uncharacterized protein n=1 Tax=Hymenoscyphus fraxineus TaxID=746836 RepID=A0A9N9LCU4_9HELO|nr:hypothetical protein HYFRA_00013692 [Hymenoscyphus fraxineus]